MKVVHVPKINYLLTKMACLPQIEMRVGYDIVKTGKTANGETERFMLVKIEASNESWKKSILPKLCSL